MKVPAWARAPLPQHREHEPRAADAAPVAADTRTASPGHPEAWTRSILLVEDNAYLAAMAEMLLETLGYKIKYAATARQALDILSGGAAVDAVFTDILMPGGMSGVEFAKVVRERQPDLPIVLTTGSPIAAEEARALGFVVLERPCPVDMLESTLRGLLAQTSQAELSPAEASSPESSSLELGASEPSASVVRLDRRRAVA